MHISGSGSLEMQYFMYQFGLLFQYLGTCQGYIS
jgi:hypothetical protein